MTLPSAHAPEKDQSELWVSARCSRSPPVVAANWTRVWTNLGGSFLWMIVTLSSSWIVSKQPNIENSVDQVGVQVVALPSVVSTVTRVVQDGMNSDNIPVLSSDPNGPVWLVTQTSSAKATARFWEMLLDRSTFLVQ